jgi:hypothetical protein
MFLSLTFVIVFVTGYGSNFKFCDHKLVLVMFNKLGIETNRNIVNFRAYFGHVCVLKYSLYAKEDFEVPCFII